MHLSGSTSPGAEASSLNKDSAKEGVARTRDTPSSAPPRKMRRKLISVSPQVSADDYTFLWNWADRPGLRDRAWRSHPERRTLHRAGAGDYFPMPAAN